MKQKEKDWTPIFDLRLPLLTEIVDRFSFRGADINLETRPGETIEIGAGECGGVFNLVEIRLSGDHEVVNRASRIFNKRQKSQRIPRQSNTVVMGL